MRDDNNQQREEHEHQQWYERDHEILNEFDKLRPIIEGKKNDKSRNNACIKETVRHKED